MDIEELLERFEVDHPAAWRNEVGPKGWWAVSDTSIGIIAYFENEVDAFRFRLDKINRILNP